MLVFTDLMQISTTLDSDEQEDENVYMQDNFCDDSAKGQPLFHRGVRDLRFSGF